MPRQKSTYEAIIAAKQRELASTTVIAALREGTDLSMTLAKPTNRVHRVCRQRTIGFFSGPATPFYP